MSKLVCKHVLKERWEGLLDREPCTIKVWRCWTGDQIVGVKAETNDLNVYFFALFWQVWTAKYLSGWVCKLEINECYTIIMMTCAGLGILVSYGNRINYPHRVACVTSCFAMFCWRQRNQQEHRQLCVCVVTVAFINSVSKQWFVPKLCFPSGSLQI